MLTGIPDVPVVTSPYLTVGEVVGGVILFHAAVPLIYPLEIIVCAMAIRRAKATAAFSWNAIYDWGKRDFDCSGRACSATD